MISSLRNLKKKIALRTTSRCIAVLLIVAPSFFCAAASVNVQSFGATGNGTSDDAPAFNQAIASGASDIYVPCGSYLINEEISLSSTSSVHLHGAGDCSIIRPSAAFKAGQDAVDVSGAVTLQLDHVAFDMLNVSTRPTYSVIAGVPSSGTYGPISVHNITIYNNNWQGIAIGTSGPNAALNGLTINNNVIVMNRCAPNLCGNAIDTGSVGQRTNVSIQNNIITYPPNSDAGSAPGGEGIFCGHGRTSNFTIQNNTIENAPTNGIAIYARPFNATDLVVSATQYTIANNVISAPARACIALFGASSTVMSTNKCLDPTQTGISVTYGITSGGDTASDFAVIAAQATNNLVISGENNSSIQNCIYLSGDGTTNSVANRPTGTFQGNGCIGASGTPLGADQDIISTGVQSLSWYTSQMP